MPALGCLTRYKRGWTKINWDRQLHYYDHQVRQWAWRGYGDRRRAVRRREGHHRADGQGGVQDGWDVDGIANGKEE